MSSCGLVFVVRPGGRLVVPGARLEAAVEDADEPVGELAQRGVVDSPWLLWRLHRLEGRMESWHTTTVPTPPSGATRPSCVSGRCAWCWRPSSRPASASA